MSADAPPMENPEPAAAEAKGGRRVSFWVPGRPRPQGSKRALGPGIMVEQSRHVGNWRARITGVALSVRDGWELFDDPVHASLHFYYARPKSHFFTGRRAGLLRPSAQRFPTSRNYGDTDKLVRATFDALAGVLVHDDAQIVSVLARKCYAEDGVEGVSIALEPA